MYMCWYICAYIQTSMCVIYTYMIYIYIYIDIDILTHDTYIYIHIYIYIYMYIRLGGGERGKKDGWVGRKRWKKGWKRCQGHVGEGIDSIIISIRETHTACLLLMPR